MCGSNSMRILILIFTLLINGFCIGVEILDEKHSKIEQQKELKSSYVLLRDKAEKGDIESKYEIFMLIYENEPKLYEYANEAFSYIIQAGQAGHTDSQFIIGSLYQTGHMVKKNLDVALTWLTEAAKKGHIEAQYLVGSNYYIRINIDDNPINEEYKKNAVFWYQKAIENNYVPAIWQLGLLLVTTETDKQRGKELIKEAALKGDKRAMYFYAIEFKHKWKKSYNDEDFQAAVKWYNNAIELGHVASKNDLKELLIMKKSRL